MIKVKIKIDLEIKNISELKEILLDRIKTLPQPPENGSVSSGIGNCKGYISIETKKDINI